MLTGYPNSRTPRYGHDNDRIRPHRQKTFRRRIPVVVDGKEECSPPIALDIDQIRRLRIVRARPHTGAIFHPGIRFQPRLRTLPPWCPHPVLARNHLQNGILPRRQAALLRNQ